MELFRIVCLEAGTKLAAVHLAKANVWHWPKANKFQLDCWFSNDLMTYSLNLQKHFTDLSLNLFLLFILAKKFVQNIYCYFLFLILISNHYKKIKLPSSIKTGKIL